MASCDIQVVSPSVLSRIESFLNDPAYREAIENSSTFNTRLCIERRLRLPFLDSQTGVAQNHSNLFMSARERIPGLNDGQVYTYPSKRWRKKRRQYLMQPQVCMRRIEGSSDSGGDLHTISTVENPAATLNEDSKDSGGLKDDLSNKASQDAWYYDELELQAMEGYDEGDQDSDYDYEEPYSKRRKKRGPNAKPARNSSLSVVDSPHQKKGPKGTGVGRGRKKGGGGGTIIYDATDTEKPFSCDLCGARYKTRPGLTYHYTHSHKERSSGSGGVSSSPMPGVPGVPGGPLGPGLVPVGPGGPLPPAPPGPPGAPTNILMEEEAADPASPVPPAPIAPMAPIAPSDPSIVQGWTKFQDSYLTYLNAPGTSRQSQRGRPGMPGPPGPPPHMEESPLPPSMSEKKMPPSECPQPVLLLEQQNKERAAPSPYCDFCLGDADSNKKSGQPEELVSCSDCGRSGHPTCLQFTDNMIVSVRKYRWQCIECKCCSICGTSDNDDQLLFCDDCDRGYHMYCLVPPLTTPPEGSWSCRLCIAEFHSGK